MSNGACICAGGGGPWGAPRPPPRPPCPPCPPGFWLGGGAPAPCCAEKVMVVKRSVAATVASDSDFDMALLRRRALRGPGRSGEAPVHRLHEHVAGVCRRTVNAVVVECRL